MFAYYLHNLDPFIFRITGNVGPRWYGLAYVLAFVFAFLLLRVLAKRGYLDLPVSALGDFVTWVAFFGVMVGGRIGYVLFYRPEMLRDPLSILRVWEGGMSSHGGILGVVLSPSSTRAGTNCPGRTRRQPLRRRADRSFPWPLRELHQRRVVWPRYQRFVGCSSFRKNCWSPAMPIRRTAPW